MRKFGLIGYPLGHSFSKKYFTDKFHNEHITDCSYENYPIENIGSLPFLISSDADLAGLNVTIPYKSEVIRFIDSISPEADEIGAVNVIKILRSGSEFRLAGYNSDITGIRDSLNPYFPGKGGNAIVLGTGGSSKAVCYVLKNMGMNVTSVSRNSNPGIITYSGINRDLIENADLIVNTTPLGMFPDIYSFPSLDYTLLNRKTILFDLVYNPELTSFLKKGQEQGCMTISGIKMLRSQAERAWEIWNDEML